MAGRSEDSYRIGKPGQLIRAYPDFAAIIALAEQYDIHATYPGYGFLSKNAHFAKPYQDAGLVLLSVSVAAHPSLPLQLSRLFILDTDLSPRRYYLC
jgi:pyruvate carboxylase